MQIKKIQPFERENAATPVTQQVPTETQRIMQRPPPFQESAFSIINQHTLLTGYIVGTPIGNVPEILKGVFSSIISRRLHGTVSLGSGVNVNDMITRVIYNGKHLVTSLDSDFSTLADTMCVYPERETQRYTQKLIDYLVNDGQPGGMAPKKPRVLSVCFAVKKYDPPDSIPVNNHSVKYIDHMYEYVIVTFYDDGELSIRLLGDISRDIVSQCLRPIDAVLPGEVGLHIAEQDLPIDTMYRFYTNCLPGTVVDIPGGLGSGEYTVNTHKKTSATATYQIQSKLNISFKITVTEVTQIHHEPKTLEDFLRSDKETPLNWYLVNIVSCVISRSQTDDIHIIPAFMSDFIAKAKVSLEPTKKYVPRDYHANGIDVKRHSGMELHRYYPQMIGTTHCQRNFGPTVISHAEYTHETVVEFLRDGSKTAAEVPDYDTCSFGSNTQKKVYLISENTRTPHAGWVWQGTPCTFTKTQKELPKYIYKYNTDVYTTIIQDFGVNVLTSDHVLFNGFFPLPIQRLGLIGPGVLPGGERPEYPEYAQYEHLRLGTPRLPSAVLSFIYTVFQNILIKDQDTLGVLTGYSALKTVSGREMWIRNYCEILAHETPCERYRRLNVSHKISFQDFKVRLTGCSHQNEDIIHELLEKVLSVNIIVYNVNSKTTHSTGQTRDKRKNVYILKSLLENGITYHYESLVLVKKSNMKNYNHVKTTVIQDLIIKEEPFPLLPLPRGSKVLPGKNLVCILDTHKIIGVIDTREKCVREYDVSENFCVRRNISIQEYASGAFDTTGFTVSPAFQVTGVPFSSERPSSPYFIEVKPSLRVMWVPAAKNELIHVTSELLEFIYSSQDTEFVSGVHRVCKPNRTVYTGYREYLRDLLPCLPADILPDSGDTPLIEYLGIVAHKASVNITLYKLHTDKCIRFSCAGNKEPIQLLLVSDTAVLRTLRLTKGELEIISKGKRLRTGG